ncbi:MAG: hypothetical protein JWM68_1311 [Verrucomicrobiales bacterium]|nr:hypothetical protein [Verrucomicrobiales bacterium]
MKSNPGGQISTDEAIGRGDLIERIWVTLEAQSIYMNAERRIGKTTILEILKEKPKTGWFPSKRDLEGCHTAAQFAHAVYRDIDAFLGTGKKAMRRVSELFTKAGGTEIGGVFSLPEGKEAPWKEILEKSFQDLVDAQKETQTRIVFLWDEVPFMLDNIRNQEGDKMAMEVLDFLRYLRQTYRSIRMVLTGSIGLHHVVSTLKVAKYANAPINDMAAVEVPPLAQEDGEQLASLLLKGEGIVFDDLAAVSGELARIADHFPYYIHHIVRTLKFSGKSVSKGQIDALVVCQLINENDPWELRHYRERITTYYGADEKVAVAVLDAVACSSKPIALEQIFKEVTASIVFRDLDHLRELLKLLQKDHYICREGEGFGFKFPLIRRWWLLDRTLKIREII